MFCCQTLYLQCPHCHQAPDPPQKGWEVCVGTVKEKGLGKGGLNTKSSGVWSFHYLFITQRRCISRRVLGTIHFSTADAGHHVPSAWGKTLWFWLPSHGWGPTSAPDSPGVSHGQNLHFPAQICMYSPHPLPSVTGCEHGDRAASQAWLHTRTEVHSSYTCTCNDTNVHAYVITCWCPAPHVLLLPAWGTAQLRGHVHVCVCVCA